VQIRAQIYYASVQKSPKYLFLGPPVSPQFKTVNGQRVRSQGGVPRISQALN